MDILAAISSAQLFRELSEESRKGLAAVCFHKHIRKREVLFAEADEGLCLYFLFSGNIQLAKRAPDNTDRVIKVVQPGEMFAEVVLFEETRYPVTATALVDSLVLVVPREAFHQLLDQASFRSDFIAALLRRQRYLAERIYSLTAVDAEQRFFDFLREHFGDQRTIAVTLSKKDIAAAIGVAPETLSRMVQRLESEGRLIWKGKQIELG